ncbi:MAG: M23 family metallopeptidase [Anaerolineales bacterium]|jgi:murein DD-endopeptidase MepM/ murein hydrolase activator NlpD
MVKKTGSPRLFTGISWGVTILIVAGLLGFGFWRFYPSLSVSAAAQAAQSATPTGRTALAAFSTEIAPGTASTNQDAIVRKVWLKTSITSKTTYTISDYTVQPGDALFSIAAQFNIKPETLLWANNDILQGSPDSLRIGQVLKVPPVDGVYYQVQTGDTLASIADKFSAKLDDILNWPGNDIDLTTQQVTPGDYVMVPGGQEQVVVWVVPSVPSTGALNSAGNPCGAGPVGNGFIWPTGNHYLSGNNFWSGHPGIDIAAGLGAPVWAASAGTVTIAQGGWNGGYGNVVMIDHNNGYLTVYGHLSQINVVPCESVSAGSSIGLAGSTGNSTGPHLHFEIRQNGVAVDPWYLLPAP